MATRCGNVVNITYEKEFFDENLNLIYHDYPKEDDIVEEVEFKNKLTLSNFF